MSKKHPDDEAAKGGPPATVKARVIFAGPWGPMDAVVSVTPEEAAAGTAAGELDADPGAVAYAESLAS
jgi:hypothetical protein